MINDVILQFDPLVLVIKHIQINQNCQLSSEFDFFVSIQIDYDMFKYNAVHTHRHP